MKRYKARQWDLVFQQEAPYKSKRKEGERQLDTFWLGKMMSFRQPSSNDIAEDGYCEG